MTSAIGIDQIVSYTVATISFVAAVWQGLKNSNRESKVAQDTELLSDAKMHQERARVLQQTAEENMSLYKVEREEHKATREYWHNKASENQAALLVCQERIQELRDKPDLTDLLHFIEEQSKTSVSILQGIEKILHQLQDNLTHRQPKA